MILEPLATILEELPIDLPVFINFMPSTVKEGVLLLNKLRGAAIDHDTGLRRSSFQVIVRHVDQIQAIALAEQVMGALTMNRRQLEGAEVKYILPRHEPVVYPISEGGLLECSVNFDAVYARQ